MKGGTTASSSASVAQTTSKNSSERKQHKQCQRHKQSRQYVEKIWHAEEAMFCECHKNLEIEVMKSYNSINFN